MPMDYTANEIRTILQSKGILGDGPMNIRHISIDTRAIVHPRSTLFVALKGSLRDGHNYIKQAYKNGVRNFLVDHQMGLTEGNEFVVDDVLEALQKLSKYHRDHFKGRVVGITGSNGKTTVKEWLYHLLPNEINVCRSPMSFNSQIGVPLSLLNLSEENEIAIIEAGISQPNEMKILSDLVTCDIGIFTMIGDAHSAGFSDRKSKLNDKLTLFDSCDTVIYNMDQEDVHKAMLSRFSGKNLIQISFDSSSESNISFDYSASDFFMRQDQTSHNVPFNPLTLYDSQNMALAITACLHLDVELSNIFNRLQYISAIPMRLETDIGKNGSIIINDSYSADLSSFKMALEHIKVQGEGRKKIVVISEFLDLQKDANHLDQIAHLIEKYQVDEVYAIGDPLKGFSNYISDAILVKWHHTLEDLMVQGQPKVSNNEILLIKGARKYKFERLFRSLTSKLHETVLEVDLNALGHNLGLFSKSLRSDTKVMAMVKASAYGAGLIEVARYLAFRNIDYLGVTFIDEGIQLRQAGIRLPIFVLSPDLSRLDDIKQFNLEIAINALEDWTTIANSQSMGLKMHINIDTGMTRLGIQAADFDKFLRLISVPSEMKIVGIFSHLAAADVESESAFTRQQGQILFDLSSQLMAQLQVKSILIHMLNTSGILHYPDLQFDMVRLGIGLYGVSGDIIDGERLEPVFTLKSVIKSIKNIKKGESVGYGRSWKAKRDSAIASIPIGYADGLFRSSSDIEVLVQGNKAPIVGHVCMDITMIDVTDLVNVKNGDEVVLFGNDRPIEVMAKANNTIPYEIISRLSNRIKRLYIR